MRSTPWPKLILRTVKEPWGPFLTAMTIPSKAWRRSLSPSLIFTCTRMVSPGAKSGRSVRWSLSASFCMIGWIDIVVSLLEVAGFSLHDFGGFAERNPQEVVCCLSWRDHSRYRRLTPGCSGHHRLKRALREQRSLPNCPDPQLPLCISRKVANPFQEG